ETFALHPNQGEIGMRGPARGVAFVEHGNALAEPGEPQRQGGADQPAADDGDVVACLRLAGPHRSSPARPTSSRSRPKVLSSTTKTAVVNPITTADTEATSGSMLSWM